jgi:hypothetical protein
MAQKMKLIEEMNEQLDLVWQQVLAFKLDIKDVMHQGLVKIGTTERKNRVDNIQTMWSKLKTVAAPAPVTDELGSQGTQSDFG